MCFSPEADLVGGIVVSGIGVDTVRHIDRQSRQIALAVLPLLLGFHQLVESVLWLVLQGHLPNSFERPALWIYLLIALVVLPIFIPTAVLFLETTSRRKLSMVPFVIVGVSVAAILLAAMARGPMSVTLRPYHLSYHLSLSNGPLVVGLYVVAVCGALLFSGERHFLFFGIVNLIAVGVIAWLTVDGFASVWCAWAAITSAAIAVHLRFARVHRARTLQIA